MKLGWLLKLYFLEDRFAIILLRTFKFGIIRTKRDGLNGFSFALGILFLEIHKMFTLF